MAKMYYYIVNILLIASLAMLETYAQTCEESRQLDAKCGSYCFKIVKPVLEHTKTLQEKVDDNEYKQNSEMFNKIETLERLLNEKFDKLEQHMLKKKSPERITFKRIASKYYLIEHNEELNWFQAAHKCRTLGGNLVSLQCREEFNALAAKLQAKFYWLDINDLGKEKDFYSLTTGERAKYLNWYHNEPNNAMGREHCVQLRKVNGTYAMNDDNCSEKHHYICERNEE